MLVLSAGCAAQAVVGPTRDNVSPVSAPSQPAAIDSFEVQRAIAEVLITQKKYDEARTKLLLLEKIQPHDEQVQFLLGLLDMQ
ncbi:MAG: hypothetical protein KGQ42_07590, partial [Alphaproteobacteria bacterium]|nr:hypothetical protein [Alphaproteobacteria bacterium]